MTGKDETTSLKGFKNRKDKLDLNLSQNKPTRTKDLFVLDSLDGVTVCLLHRRQLVRIAMMIWTSV
jgi:hypothetical protein